MKAKLFIILLSLASCGAPKPKEIKTDSVPPVTEYITLSPETSNATTGVDGQIETVLGTDARSLLIAAYLPAHLNGEDEIESGEYVLQSSNLIEGEYTTLDGKCVNVGTILFSLAAFYDGPQEKGKDDEGDVFFRANYTFLSLAKSEEKVQITFRSDFKKDRFTLNLNSWINRDYKLCDECGSLAIEIEDSGGSELPWHKRIISFYLFDGMQLREVLNLETVNDFTTNSFTEGPVNHYSEQRIIEVLETSTHDLKDIKARFLRLNTNGSIASDKEEVYRFNGQVYKLADSH